MEPTTPPATTDTAASDEAKKNGIRIGAVIALAILAGLVAWILIERNDDDSATSTTTTAATTATSPSTAGPATTATPVGPVAVSAAKLSTVAAATGHLVYWAGAVPGRHYEFTLTNADQAYVRYLPLSAKAGAPGADYLIIATYPFPDAYNALKKVGNGNEVDIPGGGIALVSGGYPQSVHFAFPDTDYQGEVYDPSAAKALAVATSGDLQPVP